MRLATGWTFRGSNPGGVEIFRTCPDRPWGPPSLLYNGYRAPNSVWAGITQSVRLCTGWTVRRSNPGGVETFRACPDWPWDPPSLLNNGYRVFPGGKEQPERDADPSPLLVPWSRKGRAIPLLPLWAVRPVQSFSACTRVTFTFRFYI